jgi:hypothetical protein
MGRMNKIEKLRENARMAEANIARLKAEKADAENAVIENPNNSEAAIKAAAASMQVSAAEKAFQRALDAIEAEERRLNSKEYKDAVKQVKELEKQAEKIQSDGIGLIRSFYDKYHEFVEVGNEYQELANKHEIEHKPLIMKDRAEAGLDAIHRALIPWFSHREHVEYRKQHPQGG